MIDFVKNDYKLSENSIFLIGQGFGTAITMDYVSKYEWNNPIILISPFKSVFAIARETDKYNYLFEMAEPYVDLSKIDVFNSTDKINKIKCPVKIIHGKDNDFISIEQAEFIYSLLTNKDIDPLWMDNCGHFDLLSKIDFPLIFDELIKKIPLKSKN
jgi:pimeloyl-ACP methyl ester carboxylesterase